MPSCNIVRVACVQNGVQKFWTVRPGGALTVCGESEAQHFVCHSEMPDRSCLIQHWQSGAFIEQGADRKLKLALSAASAAVFSKLRAYSEGTSVTQACILAAQHLQLTCTYDITVRPLLWVVHNGCHWMLQTKRKVFTASSG